MASLANSAISQGVNTSFEPFVDLSFPIRGKTLPADHGYGLYAALVHLLPNLREQSQVQILTIPGIPDKQGKILLTERSHLHIRVPVSQIPLVYQTAGKKITVGIHEIQIGIPAISVLYCAPTLRSRIVTIKGKECMQPNPFLAAARRQLDGLGIAGQLAIPLNQDKEPSRKTIKIQNQTIVGFTTEVTGLSDEESLKVQQYGLGGKRHMGCGVFVPWTSK